MTGSNTAEDKDNPEQESDLLAKSELELDKAISELRGETADAAGPESQPLEPAPIAESPSADQPMRRASDNRIIMSIPVSVDIVLGTTEMPVHELMSLKRGATVTLDRRIGEPVDVVVSGKQIARGEIVVLEDDPTRFGIKLTDVVES